MLNCNDIVVYRTNSLNKAIIPLVQQKLQQNLKQHNLVMKINLWDGSIIFLIEI